MILRCFLQFLICHQLTSKFLCRLLIMSESFGGLRLGVCLRLRLPQVGQYFVRKSHRYPLKVFLGWLNLTQLTYILLKIHLFLTLQLLAYPLKEFLTLACLLCLRTIRSKRSEVRKVGYGLSVILWWNLRLWLKV